MFVHDKVGLPECPYLERYIIDFKLFSIRLHHWIASDDQRYFHDHGWNFLTIVLKGGYEDISPHFPCKDKNCIVCETLKSEEWKNIDRLHPGSIRFRKATHQHTVQVNKGGAWTLLITGREKREWGFWVNGKEEKSLFLYERTSSL